MLCDANMRERGRGEGRDHRARRVAVSRPFMWNALSCERRICADIWRGSSDPVTSPCKDTTNSTKISGVTIMIWRQQVDVGVEAELIARYTNSSGGSSMWLRWAGMADQKMEQRKDTRYETRLLRVSRVLLQRVNHVVSWCNTQAASWNWLARDILLVQRSKNA